MGYKKVVFNGIEYQLTRKWYKEYLSAIEILKKDKEINTDELDISELVDIRDVKIDSKKPYLIRMISYINQVKHKPLKRKSRFEIKYKPKQKLLCSKQRSFCFHAV